MAALQVVAVFQVCNGQDRRSAEDGLQSGESLPPPAKHVQEAAQVLS